jgi:hypothetical protein
MERGTSLQILRYLSALCTDVPQSQYSVEKEDLTLICFEIMEHPNSSLLLLEASVASGTIPPSGL